jgi:hypothetical protein
MAERHNTVVCSFDLANPWITAHDIHEWIFAVLQNPEHSVQMIQIDGIKRRMLTQYMPYYRTRRAKPNINTRQVRCQLSISHWLASVPSAFALQTCHRRHPMILSRRRSHRTEK